MRHLIIILLAAAASILSTAPAHADLTNELFKLLPNDGAANDQFGKSVAISGTIAVVGTLGDDDNGHNSGSAYIFDTKTGEQIAKFLPDHGAIRDLFGWSVAISGNTVIVGAIGGDGITKDSGSAYIFDISDPENPVQITELIAEDGENNDNFGVSVAINGTTAIIGARYDSDNGPFSGSAYLFNTISGQQIAKLLPDDGEFIDSFGIAVAISAPGNQIAIVGAPNGDDENGFDTGSVYLFSAATGQQIAKLLANDFALSQFGHSVAVSGTTIIIGAPLDDDNGTSSGSAYLFNVFTGQQIAKLLPSDGAVDDLFGISVGINGTTAIVGAQSHDDNGINSGSAYLFDISNPEIPTQFAKLLASDGAANDWFGEEVSINGTTAIVGARLDNDNGDDSGSAYIFNAVFTPGNCPWDLDCSGSVSTSDLLELFAQWGTDGPADFDGSGEVGTADLLILFANWGPCP